MSVEDTCIVLLQKDHWMPSFIQPLCVCVSNCESDWVKFLIYIALLTVDIIKQLPNIDLNLMQQIIHLICWIKMNCSFQLVISVQIQVFYTVIVYIYLFKKIK